MLTLLHLACTSSVLPSDGPGDSGDPPTTDCSIPEREPDSPQRGVEIQVGEMTLWIAGDIEPQETEVAVVVVHGGFGGEQVPPPERLVLRPGASVLQIHVDLPGSDTHPEPEDLYGEQSRAALAKTLSYAAGDVKDASGCTLNQRAELLGDVVLVGLSNGGNLTVATLADSSLEMPQVSALMLWETPSSAPFAAHEYYRPELGECSYDGTLSCEMDYGQLAWEGAAYLDRDGDGVRSDTEPMFNGIQNSKGVRFYSPAVRPLLPDAPHLATLAQTEEFWSQREAASLTGQALAQHPDLRVLLVANAIDHVQDIPGSPHVIGLGQAFRESADWVRLNPDTFYTSREENLANEGLDLSDRGFLLPGEGGILEMSLGAWELADRLRADDWSADLDDTE